MILSIFLPIYTVPNIYFPVLNNPLNLFHLLIKSKTLWYYTRHNWYVLPPSHTATLLIILNLLTILLTTLILHLSFFGRLLALYKRNFLRVQCLTRYGTVLCCSISYSYLTQSSHPFCPTLPSLLRHLLALPLLPPCHPYNLPFLLLCLSHYPCSCLSFTPLPFPLI
jgi:hypothetical protein